MYRTLRFLSQAPIQSIRKSVIVSQSHDIYTNLALEDWLYTHREFDDHNVLMLWSNDPCVVIGRYQIPWLEANVAELPLITQNGVHLARRKSGGGTVYQDRGNLNLTFFTSKKQYNRKHNLEIIARAVLKDYGVQISLNSRDDLVIDDCKLSGTAAKLSRLNAYHHCTLLVNADKSNLSRALHKQRINIKTNASQSIRSKVMNLSETIAGITVNDLLWSIGREYSNGGNFQYVNPEDVLFTGLPENRDELKSWSWCYGNSPKFTITKSFPIPTQFNNGAQSGELGVAITVENGKITDVGLTDPLGIFPAEVHIVDQLKGCRFTQDAFNSIIHLLIEDKNKFVTECVRQVMVSL